MISLRKSDVPQYLHDSQFYRSLSDEEGETFELSSDNFKVNCEISKSADLNHLLSTLRFWGTAEHPIELNDYIWTHDVTDYESIFASYWDELTYLKLMASVMHVDLPDRINTAVPFGDLSFIQYMLRRGCVFDWTACQTAARCGEVECLQYLLSQTPNEKRNVDQHIVQAAIEAGQFEVLQFMADNDEHDIDWMQCLYVAARSGSVKCLKYLYEEKCHHQWSVYADFYQIQDDDGKYLRFARELNISYDYSVKQHVMMFEAVQRGVLPVVEYLLSKNLPLHARLLSAAAASGHAEIMYYVYTHHYCDVEACANASAAAAGHGHLHCLQYAHQHFPFPWNAEATTAAAAGNHLECLQYLHQHGCPWNHYTTDAAIRLKSAECLQYALEHGCPLRWKYKVQRIVYGVASLIT